MLRASIARMRSAVTRTSAAARRFGSSVASSVRSRGAMMGRVTRGTTRTAPVTSAAASVTAHGVGPVVTANPILAATAASRVFPTGARRSVSSAAGGGSAQSRARGNGRREGASSRGGAGASRRMSAAAVFGLTAAAFGSATAMAFPGKGGDDKEKVYEPCGVIGDGLRGEFWKAHVSRVRRVVAELWRCVPDRRTLIDEGLQ